MDTAKVGEVMGLLSYTAPVTSPVAESLLILLRNCICRLLSMKRDFRIQASIYAGVYYSNEEALSGSVFFWWKAVL